MRPSCVGVKRTSFLHSSVNVFSTRVLYWGHYFYLPIRRVNGPPFLCPMISSGAKYWSTEKFTGQDRTVKSRLIQTPHCLSPVKKALTFSLDSTPLLRTLSMSPSVSVVMGFDCTLLLSYFRTLSIGPASCTSPSYSQTLYRVSLSFRFKVETHHRRFSSVHVLRAEPKCNLRRKRMKGMGEVGHGSRSPPLSSSLLSTPLDLILFTLNPLLSPPSQIPPPFWGWKLRSPPPPFSFKSPLPLIILH